MEKNRFLKVLKYQKGSICHKLVVLVLVKVRFTKSEAAAVCVLQPLNESLGAVQPVSVVRVVSLND